MSFSLNVVKDNEGNLSIEHYHTNTDSFPDKIVIAGHVDEDGKTVDLSARVTGLFASASRREYPV
jgi:putative aminopeptidase FrvX